MINLYTKKLEDVWFGVACDKEKIFAAASAFNKSQTLQSLVKSVPYNVPFRYSEKASIFAERVISLLKDVYDGKGVSHGFSLATEHLSNYAKIVIKVTSLIPLGYVASYGSVAKVAGGSPRSVGRIMALNPFPLLVPCHRVVCSDFALGGYDGGLAVKQDILGREKRGYADKREISVNKRKLQVFPVELVLGKVEKKKIKR